MKKTGTTRNDYDDDDFIFGGFGAKESIVVFEEDPPPPQFTGLLNSRGEPIYRVSPPRPPIGFHIDPDVAYLYDIDPDNDFVYSDDLHPPTESED